MTPAAAQATPSRADSTTVNVTLSPTTAVSEPCAAGWLCLYRNTGYINKKFETQRQNACWLLADYGLQNAVFSYDNNLPVYGHFYNSAKANVWNIRNGGHSSDSSSFSGEHWFCTGSARP
ncbi:hypothetical protein ALI144C_19065 [Actinosynnema sp. ALI-1.44]|nr:hypothetical protein ALI144C_19065 [Actinosynnema sp. ALI-1.44]